MSAQMYASSVVSWLPLGTGHALPPPIAESAPQKRKYWWSAPLFENPRCTNLNFAPSPPALRARWTRQRQVLLAQETVDRPLGSRVLEACLQLCASLKSLFSDDHERGFQRRTISLQRYAEQGQANKTLENVIKRFKQADITLPTPGGTQTIQAMLQFITQLQPRRASGVSQLISYDSQTGTWTKTAGIADLGGQTELFLLEKDRFGNERVFYAGVYKPSHPFIGRSKAGRGLREVPGDGDVDVAVKDA
ncbi:hypothetical protein B0H17DRAFT_1142887 [Mycena rosella]|uniref:Uncharacterized protein n=1 Tax=Mycena rosella TaxID=1033263 RepID=A0AAD7G535_MYCRO|nr:hypothetical protein B0H17DRAFT_1142887 [Mycena rosella]